MAWNNRWTDEKRLNAEAMFREVVVGARAECEISVIRFVCTPEGRFQVWRNGHMTLDTTDPEEAHKRWMLYVRNEVNVYLLCAAIYVNDGKDHARGYGDMPTGIVFPGLRHGQCFELLNLWSDRLSDDEKAEIEDYDLRGHNQGFLTSTGRYVNREEAAVIAYEAGQTDRPLTSLCSEDLY